MSNPLIDQMSRSGPSVGGVNLQQIIGMIRGNDPAVVTQLLAQRNPQFAQFVQSCQGKTMEQVAQEYGIDPNQIRSLMK